MKINANSFFLQSRSISKNNIPFVQNNKYISDVVSYINPNINIESMYGGNKEISKEDAILYQYRKDNPLSLFESNSNKNPVYNISDIPQEYIDNLNNKQIDTWDKYRFQFALDFDKYGINLSSSVDSLAAAYVTALNHLQNNFTGSQLDGYISELETMVSDIKKSMADYFSQNVGGFLEQNGIDGQTEEIYNRIISEYDKKVKDYNDFIKENNDYARLKNTSDEWLMNDVAYMSQKLQKEFNTQNKPKNENENNYNLNEISIANRLIKEVKNTSMFDSLGNEESIGLEAGISMLKTKLFSENINVSSEFANMMTDAVKNYIDNEIDDENEKILSMYDEEYAVYNKEKDPIYDKSEIYKVVDKMLAVYKEKGDFSDAIWKGIEFAINQNDKKENPFGKIGRYKDNIYWNRFFDNSDIFTSKYYIYINGADTRTSFTKIKEDWNDFVFEITKSSDGFLKDNNFSIMA